jgi:hypothetical protein
MNITLNLWRVPVALMVSLTFTQTTQAQTVPEYTLKASYLFNFMVYTQWTNFTRDKAHVLNLCVLGQDNFGTALNNLQDKTINGTRLIVSRLSNMAGVKKCNLLFVTEREAGNMVAINRYVGNAPILTVADTPAAADAAILMTLEGKRLVFDVNMTRVKQGGLNLSSKVLLLARNTTY